ncbi:MAG: hypothetical protein H7A36_05045 [Chlamydiales bacterium]|nr:hypothetical protein [Chlamydiales bacterium]
MIECLKCLPWGTSPTLEKGSLGKREVCPAWRMVPAIFSLAVCIMGIVVCLIYKNPYLSIPFGVGALCSIYGIYLGLEYKDLQTLQAGTEKLTEENVNLSRTNRELTGQVADLRREKEGIAAERAKLEEQNGTLQTTVGDLQGTESSLRVEVKRLAQTNEEQAAREEEQKAALTAAQAILANSNEQLTGLTEQLQGFSKGNTELQALVTAIKDIVAVVDLNAYAQMYDKMRRIQGEVAEAAALLPEYKQQLEQLKLTRAELEQTVKKLEGDQSEAAKRFDEAALKLENLLGQLESELNTLGRRK